MTQKSNLIKIIKQSYRVLKAPEYILLEKAFEQEARLREAFNVECISFIDSACIGSEEILLPKYYSVKSIISEMLADLLGDHKNKRFLILKIARIARKPFKLIFKPEKYIEIEERLFIFLSTVFILLFFIKRLSINIVSVFSRLKLIGCDNDNSSHYLVCVGFPWYSYARNLIVEQNKNTSNRGSMFLGLADYILNASFPKNTRVISVGEYHSNAWESSPELHGDLIIDKRVALRRFANPVSFIKQFRRQFINMKSALKIIAGLRISNYLDKIVVTLSILKYCTSSVDTQEFINDLKKKNIDVTIFYNANAFYSFPWYANAIDEKYHYMYADNCCYFPFSYFSPSINANYSPKIIENNMLLYGFLEWPIWNRIVGEKDIGYQGVSRLSHSINKRVYNIESSINEELPLQLGSIQRFSASSKISHANEFQHGTGRDSVLFLDGGTRDTNSQLPFFDVPATFYRPEVAKVYYESLFNLIKNQDVTIYIRPKYRATNDLVDAVNNFISENKSYADRVVIVSSRLPLQNILSSTNPSVVLVRPLSSTYLFSRELGYQSYYYLPKCLSNIFDKMIYSKGLSNPNIQDDWISEDDIKHLLQSDRRKEKI